MIGVLSGNGHRVRVMGYKTFGLSLKWGWGRDGKRHQSALHGGGVFLRLPVAELLVV